MGATLLAKYVMNLLSGLIETLSFALDFSLWIQTNFTRLFLHALYKMLAGVQYAAVLDSETPTRIRPRPQPKTDSDQPRSSQAYEASVQMQQHLCVCPCWPGASLSFHPHFSVQTQRCLATHQQPLEKAYAKVRPLRCTFKNLKEHPTKYTVRRHK